jgi:hypothetical protein
MANPPRTTDQLRAQIDRGDTGEKVGFPDPAASPLGTDDEAAGTPNSPAQVAAGVAPGPSDRKAVRPGIWIYVVLAIVVIVVFAGVVYLAR